jgi:dihydrofolate synthase/folylpolyglutamate synthase
MNFIHIAGTNGKGSCTKIISNILTTQGYKVGRFLSPHLIKYNERISINGVDISDNDMINLIYELEPKIKKFNSISGKNVSLFELITIIALLYFYRNSVDFVVLETGLGGRYDSTNVITSPLVSVITSIGYDHMHLLGNTLTEIACEKAGIIKQNSDTVFYKQNDEVNNVIINTCKEKNNTLHMLSSSDISNYKTNNNIQYFDYKNLLNLSTNLVGKIQVINSCLCVEAINIINSKGYNICKQNIITGLNTVINHARMETLCTNPLIIYDGAHNTPAIIALQDIIDKYYKDCKKNYVISILKTKDYKKMLEVLSNDTNATFILTSGNDENRYVSKENLYNHINQYVSESRLIMKDLDSAIDFILNSEKNSVNFVIGSFYVYENVINKINKF